MVIPTALLALAVSGNRAVQAFPPDQTIVSAALPSPDTGKDKVVISGILAMDTWRIKLRVREDGSTNPSNPNELLASSQTNSDKLVIESAADHPGPQYIDDDGIGHASVTYDTLSEIRKYWNGGNRYYQYRDEWTRPGRNNGAMMIAYASIYSH